MVLLAAAICNKGGKALLSRQFVEMTRSRIEGLLAAFPKLMGGGSAQHTFVETESVRYVYQPLERLYVLLITTKASNILEDLETLRLFARVIPEYARGMDDKDIAENAFQLIFAFDEIVAMGYRESVNLAQIRTFTEMDSHEEKVFLAVRNAQEKEAKDAMRKKAKEMDRAKREAIKKGGKPSAYGGFGSANSTSSPHMEMNTSPVAMDRDRPAAVPAARPTAPAGSGRALKLGSKNRDVDHFVDQLRTEGQNVVNEEAPRAGRGVSSAPAAPAVAQEGVHVRVEEKMTVEAGRDGGLHNMECHGILQVKANADAQAACRLQVIQDLGDGEGRQGVQMQTHPNIDKKHYLESKWVQLKNPTRPFPIGQEVGVLKWRLATTDETQMPLAVNCWPTETNTGCDVNVDLELQDTRLELRDVMLSIPLPGGCGAPKIAEADGEYSVSRGVLEWRLPVVDADNSTAALEFSLSGGAAGDFFPVNVSFHSTKSFCGVTVAEVCQTTGDESSIPFSAECLFAPETYKIQ